MHNKYATFVLPIVAGLAIVGAGFSTWVFANQKDSSDTLSGTVSVAGVDNEGVKPTITIGKYGSETEFTAISSDTFDVLLDQGGVSAATDLTKGISVTFSDSAITDGVIDFRWKLSSGDTTSYSNAKVYLTYELSLGGVVSNYAELAGTISGSYKESSSAVLISSLKTDTDGGAYINVDANLDAGIWNYKENAKPTSLESYNSMSSALAVEGASKTEITLTVTSHYILNTDSAGSN